MRIHFHGAAHEVTGSKHLLEINGKFVLLDCGLFQGRRKESYEKNIRFGFDPSKVDAMILSHAHIDHCGNIPRLVKFGFRGDIFCTHATKDVTQVMLMDSAHIQERDSEFFRQRKSKNKPAIPLEPLYTQKDAESSFPLLQGRNYHDRFEVLPGIYCTFLDAGHILGSAVTILEFEENGEQKRLVFTGDVGRVDKIILRDPESPDWCNYLITESTYGNRLHEPFSEMRGEMGRIVTETAARGGKVIIPAFSLERTQELVYDLHVLYEEGKVPRIPIFVDSPLATRATKVFQKHPECYDEDTKKTFTEKGLDPFCCFGNLKYTESVEESKAINTLKGPAIVISASGMCEFGRIRHHLRNNVENPNNTVMIVGYQAEHTLGRRIVERRPFVKIFGEMHKLRAKVEILNGYSGHGDYNDLMNFIKPIDRISHVFIVHGEISQSCAFAKRLRNMRNNWTIEIPERGDMLDPEEITFEGERCEHCEK